LPVPPRLDHVVIAVSDWERSNAFYRDVLGVEVVELDHGRYAYRLPDGQQLNVHGPVAALELGPVARSGARGLGTSVYFRDPDGSLVELIVYE
jgi:catechol 2,3-dioxygenase-like lactoylglutathione lyase family enzyme